MARLPSAHLLDENRVLISGDAQAGESERFSMIKHKVLYVFATVIAGLSLAAGQSSKVHTTSANTGPNPTKVATKPLTPKSAMPKGKSSTAAPATSTPKTASKTDAELSRLERQPIKAANPNANKAAVKSPAVSKPVAANANGSGINSTYQKPAINKP